MSASHPTPELLLSESAWLRSLTRRLTGNADVAADLQQDVALAALTHPADARLGRSWLAAVAHNLSAMLRRSGAREQQRLRRLPEREPVPSPEQLAADAELQQRAVAAVLALPVVYRDTVLLRFMQGLSVHATAAAMAVPEETVRTRQRRALAMLRAQLGTTDARGMAALFGSIIAWGVAMKVKHVVAAAAVLLAGLLVAVPLWPNGTNAAPASPTTSPAAALAELGGRTHAGAEADAKSLLPARTEIEAAAGAAAAGHASLTVRVLWREDNAPAVGVPVLCAMETETGTFAATNDAGEATFTDLVPGDHTVHTHDWFGEVVSIAIGTHAVLEHTMARGHRVIGVVVDPDGKPVAGATILVSTSGYVPQWSFPAGRSDAQGHFACSGLRYGSLVGASHEGHGTSEFRMIRSVDGVTRDVTGNSGLPDEPGTATIEHLVLRLPGENVLVHGTVFDEEERPVPGAWVTLGQYTGGMRTAEDGSLWQVAPPTLCATDKDGSFTANLAAGELHLLVYHLGFAPQREVVTIAAGMPPLSLTLHKGGLLLGSVRDGSGKTITNATVELPYDYHPLRNSQVASDGTFRFEDLPRADLLITVSAPDFPTQQRTFTFHGGEEQRWDVVLQATAAIHGRLVDHEGHPLAGWWMMTPGVNRSQITKADGRFTVVDCAADDNTLIAVPNPFKPVRMRFMHVQPMEREQTFTVTAESAPSAHLRGQCVGPDGAPLANAKLSLFQDGHDVQDDNDGCAVDGTFDIGPLPPGSYRLIPRHPHWVFASVAAELSPSAQRDLGVCRGAEPARLVVHLLGDAELCKHTVVNLVADAVRHSDDFDSSSRTFGRVFPGHYRVVASVDGKECGRLDVDLTAGDSIERDLTLR